MVIIAGPNGAGKSTFYDLVIKDDPLMKNAPFINMDNIAKEISEPDIRKPERQHVERRQNQFLRRRKTSESRTSFVYETTSRARFIFVLWMPPAKKGFSKSPPYL